MALSNQVEENLKEAEGYLRNALHWAAKNERPVVCTTISKVIQEIEALQSLDTLIDKLENRIQGDSGGFGTFFRE
jgi:exonuclease VII small subunit